MASGDGMPDGVIERRGMASSRAYVLALAVVAADQASKAWAVASLRLHEPVEVLPVLSLTLMYNTGAAFSFLSDQGGWQRWFLAALAAVLAGFIAIWIRRSPSRLQAAGLAFVLGGAIGNLVDRLRLGHVVDFIDCHYQGWHWPAFNLADASITLGAIVLVLDGIGARKDGGVGDG